ncbi:uridine kinase [Fistulifera solaris]|uniref:Uridine kinase n=1 Tax=Fistulifera solaris TaxID=1519565 RepID=A0A1Z5JZE9_FISSO|nr:uridine kinase [Fistulifera solaris]|eukprot:GAX19395.1 uridine kinase [Fistulifera solaris]
MPIPVVTIGIAGGTGAGKTTLAHRLFQKLDESENVSYLHHDSYYRDLSHLTPTDRARNNFDHPDSLETSLLIEHIQSLKRGEAVDVPLWDFASHTRAKGTQSVTPQKIILVEGILILSDENLRRELDVMVYVDAAADIRLVRRLSRDLRERGRTVDDVLCQYNETVRPMHEMFVEPSKYKADVIVNNENPHSMAVACEVLANHLSTKAGIKMAFS